MLIAVLSAAAWMPPHSALRAPSSARQCVSMKKAPDERPDQRPEIKIDLQSIVEFHDPKHGSGDAAPVLGLVEGVEYKAKGGARLQLVDAAGRMHSVAEKAIHINLGAYKGKLKEPAEILASYAAVLERKPTELGVDPELLEMAWALAAEEDSHANFSPKFLLSLIDDDFFKGPLDAYRAFRLLSSDLGKVFFKTVGPNEYRAKAAKAVKASKENWCRTGYMEVGEPEFCFV